MRAHFGEGTTILANTTVALKTMDDGRVWVTLERDGIEAAGCMTAEVAADPRAAGQAMERLAAMLVTKEHSA